MALGILQEDLHVYPIFYLLKGCYTPVFHAVFVLCPSTWQSNKLSLGFKVSSLKVYGVELQG